MNAITER